MIREAAADAADLDATPPAEASTMAAEFESGAILNVNMDGFERALCAAAGLPFDVPAQVR